MAKKNCVICGEDGYSYYPFCYEHLQMKNKSEIEKCHKCDNWYIVADKCECQKENSCADCGKPSGTYQYCKDCYKKHTSASKKQPEYTRRAIIKEIGIESSDIRKKWDAVNRCNDGHYVRSYSETLIDNWLYDNGIVHAYEKSVYMKKNPEAVVISDFYIPEGKVYIEFWGCDTDEYEDRKDEKIALYESNGLNLISLTKDDICRLDDILPRKLGKFLK